MLYLNEIHIYLGKAAVTFMRPDKVTNLWRFITFVYLHTFVSRCCAVLCVMISILFHYISGLVTATVALVFFTTVNVLNTFSVTAVLLRLKFVVPETDYLN